MIRYNLQIRYINESFLDEGLLDEISILIGSGIDGQGRASVFDGITMKHCPFRLKLNEFVKYDNGVLWLQYKL